MVMPVKVAGAWKNATPYVKVAGVWKPVTEAHVKVAGVWRRFYPTWIDQHQLTGASFVTLYGYSMGNFGNLVDGTANFYGGAQIIDLVWDSNTGQVTLNIAGILPNQGWGRFVVNTYNYYRGLATYSNTGAASQWRWNSGNPFGGNPVVYFEG